MSRVSILVATIALAGCTVRGPVAMIAPDGDILRGTAASALAWQEFAGWPEFTVRDEFAVRGGMLECRGQTDPELGSPAVSITLGCSDGRSGIGRAGRDNAASGSGTVKMNDGSEARFVYGDAARGL